MTRTIVMADDFHSANRQVREAGINPRDAIIVTPDTEHRLRGLRGCVMLHGSPSDYGGELSQLLTMACWKMEDEQCAPRRLEVNISEGDAINLEYLTLMGKRSTTGVVAGALKLATLIEQERQAGATIHVVRNHRRSRLFPWLVRNESQELHITWPEDRQ